ncbi:MAG: hypothetical protein KDA80_24645 [Planctomycetaceae bacterium]|nr:hypothetical protein [Planctomycetaceae bacterium]
MIASKKLTLQLTPLLDLLLIVIFAQYMEVREQQVSVASQTESAVVERDAALAELMALQERAVKLQQAKEFAEAQSRMAQSALNMQKDQIEELNFQIDRTLNQARVLGELVVSMFNIPPEEVDRILAETKPAGGAAVSADVEKIRSQIQEFSSESAGEMIRHLLSYEQIRKRVDVWELHLAAGTQWTISNGERTHTFSVPFDQNEDFDANRFLAEVFAWYRSLPQPKSRVILLVTYDRSTRSYLIREAREAIPELLERMEKDSSGRSNFEFTELGFRLD